MEKRREVGMEGHGGAGREKSQGTVFFFRFFILFSSFLLLFFFSSLHIYINCLSCRVHRDVLVIRVTIESG